MLHSTKDKEDLKKLNKLVSSECPVKTLRLQDKLGKQNFHQDMKKVFEPVTKPFEDVSEKMTETMTKNFIGNNQALETSNNKLLEIMDDRGESAASYLMSPVSKITNLENTTQFNYSKDYNSKKVKHLLIRNTIPITLHNNLLTFRDTEKEFEIKGIF